MMNGKILLKHRIEYLFVASVVWFIGKLSFGAARWAGEIFGVFVYHFLPVRRRTGVENVMFALKKDKHQAERIVRQCYRGFTRSLFEFESMTTNINRENIDKYVEIHNIDILRVFVEKNKGVIFCTVHLGNWHFMDYALALHGLPLVHILKEQRNRKVFEYMTSKMKVSGKGFILLHRTPKNIMSALSQGKIVEFLCDQDAGSAGTFVDFFGKKASTVSGPALFHRKLKIPIIMAYDVYENGLHHVYLEPYEHYEKTVEEIVCDYTAYFEDVIRKYPEQYLWFHKRWNTRPPSRKNNS